jgi:drug/metabolite transporter (DMT)-like permease
MVLPTTVAVWSIHTVRDLISALDGDRPPGGDPNKNIKNWSSIIGIVTAITGNVLIALALNVQRYAHIRLHQKRNYHRLRARKALKNASNGAHSGGIYGTTAVTNGPRAILPRQGSERSPGHYTDEEFLEDSPLTQSVNSGGSGLEDDESQNEASTSYLRDPYWWLGQVLITVGEGGNFLAYGFAPASIVSPLGVVALISNCVIAPMLFKEVFRKRDFWGVIIAIAGAVTVVLSANTQETKLEPHDVWRAITTMEFEIYMAVTCSLIAVLMWASPRYGNRTILIDLGLVGLLGGYTALSTKGVSSMLSSTFLGAFTTPVTYGLVTVLVFTAIMQVRYVNRALQRFDSTQVIPIQFVMFTLCVIIGSAVLYRDFERTTARQATKFVGGCLLTFFGVFLITTGRPPHDHEEETLSDEEGVEETINLTEHERAAAQQRARAQTHSRRGSDSAASRRSSNASRVKFNDAIIKPLTPVAESGMPTVRIPPASNKKPSVGVDEDEVETPPLLTNPWEQRGGGDYTSRPTNRWLQTPAVSSDTIPTINSNAVSDTSAPPPEILQSLRRFSSQPDHPSDGHPRPSTTGSRPHSHVFGAPFLSPSPFSSTVSGALADKFLPHMHADTPLSRKVGSRRSRPSLRNSLFVSQEDLDDQAETDERGAQSDREIASGHYTDAEDDEGQYRAGGFRGRARSLSNTLGGFFGVRRKSRSNLEPDAGEQGREQEPFLARRDGEGSRDTL